MPGVRPRPRSSGARRAAEVPRITTAPVANKAHQQRNVGTYLISMGIRTACFVGMIFVPGPMRWVLAAAAVVLPYIAVVLANAGRESPRPTTTQVTPQTPRALDSPTTPLQEPTVTWVQAEEAPPPGPTSPRDAGRQEHQPEQEHRWSA